METTIKVNQLTVTNIRKSIKDKTILEDVSFNVSRRQMLAILGPTGSGKSTLLNIITGRLKCDSGSITVDGKPVDKGLRRRFGYVLQNDVFFTNLTLWQTLYFTAQIQMPEYLSNEEKEDKLNSIIEAMDLNKCLHTALLKNRILDRNNTCTFKEFGLPFTLFDLLSTLRMNKTQNCVIGDLFVRGLSGGEKKRASIACELLTDPTILFLDEPTSGLDSSTAWSTVQHLKSEAVSKKRIVVSTIHQPSSQIFHDFDKLLLITDGKTLFYGSPEDVQTHFSNLGLYCKPNYNPADFLLELAKADEDTIKKIAEAVRVDESLCTEKQNGEGRNPPNDLTDVYRNLREHKGSSGVNTEISRVYINDGYSSHENGIDVSGETDTKQTYIETTTIKSSQRWPTSFLHQLHMLTWRGFIQSRGKVLNRYALTEMFIVSTCIALGAFRKGIGYKQSRDVMALIFMIFSYWCFVICPAILFTFPEQRPVIAKERAAGAYRLSAFYIAKTIGELPILLCIAIVAFSVSFWISEIGDLNIYLKTLAVFVLWVLLSQAMAIFIGSVARSPRLAFTIFQAYNVLSFIFGGYFIQYVPNWFLWLKFCSIHMYAVSGATKIVFSGFHPISCNSSSSMDVFAQSACSNSTMITGDVILRDAGIDLPLLYYILPMIAIDFVLRLIAYLATRIRKDAIF